MNRAEINFIELSAAFDTPFQAPMSPVSEPDQASGYK